MPRSKREEPFSISLYGCYSLSVSSCLNLRLPLSIYSDYEDVCGFFTDLSIHLSVSLNILIRNCESYYLSGIVMIHYEQISVILSLLICICLRQRIIGVFPGKGIDFLFAELLCQKFISQSCKPIQIFCVF